MYTDTGQDVANLVANVSADLAKEGIELTGTAIKEILLLAINYAREKEKFKTGKVDIQKLMRSGSELKTCELDKSDLRNVEKELKKYGASYTVIKRKNQDQVTLAFKTGEQELVKKALEKALLKNVDFEKQVENISETSNLVNDLRERGEGKFYITSDDELKFIEVENIIKDDLLEQKVKYFCDGELENEFNINSIEDLQELDNDFINVNEVLKEEEFINRDIEKVKCENNLENLIDEATRKEGKQYLISKDKNEFLEIKTELGKEKKFSINRFKDLAVVDKISSNIRSEIVKSKIDNFEPGMLVNKNEIDKFINDRSISNDINPIEDIEVINVSKLNSLNEVMNKAINKEEKQYILSSDKSEFLEVETLKDKQYKVSRYKDLALISSNSSNDIYDIIEKNKDFIPLNDKPCSKVELNKTLNDLPVKSININGKVKEELYTNKSNVKLKQYPGDKHKTISKLSGGEKVDVIKKDDKWSKVKFNNEIGYIKNDELSKDKQLKESVKSKLEDIKRNNEVSKSSKSKSKDKIERKSR